MSKKGNMCSGQSLGVTMRSRADARVRLHISHDIRRRHVTAVSVITFFFLVPRLTTHFVPVTWQEETRNCSGSYKTVSVWFGIKASFLRSAARLYCSENQQMSASKISGSLTLTQRIRSVYSSSDFNVGVTPRYQGSLNLVDNRLFRHCCTRLTRSEGKQCRGWH